MTEDIKVSAIICSECNAVLDVLSGEQEILYTDKKCECGSINFYVTKINIKVVVDRPNKEPIFKWNGMEFFD